MKGKENWERMCEEIQQRSLTSTHFKVSSAKELKTQLFKCLNVANDDGVLKTSLSDIHKLLKITSSKKDEVEILGGTRNFKRRKEVPHFERVDGCWFDFAILIDETVKPAKIIGFNFELRFPNESPIKFIRYDLNLPNHNNEERGMRFHLHPGHDDLMIHSPPMSPLEILHLFLYGLVIPDKPRSS